MFDLFSHSSSITCSISSITIIPYWGQVVIGFTVQSKQKINVTVHASCNESPSVQWFRQRAPKINRPLLYSGRSMKNLYLSFVTNFMILGSKGILHPTDTHELLRCDASRWISLRTLSLYKRNHIIIFFHYIWVFFHLFNRHPTIFCIINDKLLFSHY